MTISRVNLCRSPIPTTEPDFFVASWFAVPAGDWAISTSGHATLPRQTVITGTTTAAIRASAVPVVPGRVYVGSMSMRAIAANTVSMRILWINAAGTILLVSSATVYTQAAGTTVRMYTPQLTAPSDPGGGPVLAVLDVNGVDGAAEFTAAMLEQTTFANPYLDGDVAGARWAGATNLSPSVIGTSELAGEIDYDDTLGRVRTFVTGATAIGGRAVVRRRLATQKRGQVVRGGADLDGGVALRSVDDYEFPAGPPLVYTVEIYGGRVAVLPTVAQEPESPIETVDISYTPPRPRAWLKFMASPQLNRKITIIGWDPIERPSRNALYDVQGATEPLIVTSGHSSRRTTLTLRTWTLDETRALDESMSQGIPALLHLPEDSTLPPMYCVFGTYRHTPPSRRSQGAVWTVPIIEVAAPPASIFAPGRSWQTVVNSSATWAELLDEFDTWREVGA